RKSPFTGGAEMHCRVAGGADAETRGFAVADTSRGLIGRAALLRISAVGLILSLLLFDIADY
uniref:hypothetical protein n=1 Tax=Nioella nitratireducens TaxID=1287720 RepID=UPI001F2CCD14